MLNRGPWKILKKMLAVNKPNTDWFNAVTRFATTFGVRFGADENAYIERPNTDGSDWNLVLPASLAGEDEGIKGKYHFRIERVSSTQVRVLGGRWLRYWDDSLAEVGLTGDSGVVKTISGHKTLTVSSDSYVVITLDQSASPTSLTVSLQGSYPSSLGTQEDRVIGFVSWDGVAGEIDGIEQYWSGGDISDRWFTINDDCLEYEYSSTELELYGWTAAASVGNLANADLFLFKDTTGVLQYVDWITMQGQMLNLDEQSINLHASDEVQIYGYAGATSVVPVDADLFPYKDITAGHIEWVSLEDLRDDAFSGVWWKLGNDSTADAYGQMIGDDSEVLAIQLDDRRLYADATNWTADWFAREFDGADWTFLAGTICKMADTTGASAGDTGCTQMQGGLSAKANCWMGDKLFVVGDHAATTTSDGTLQVTGGISATKQCHFELTTGPKVDFLSSSFVGQFVDGSLDVSLCGSSRALYATDGTRVLKVCDATYAADATGKINTDDGYYVNGTQVVNAQYSSVAAIASTSGTANDGTCRSKVNDIITALQWHGLIP